jgi:hypothetical protein
MGSDDPVSPSEERRDANRRERAEAIEELREHIKTLEAREPELRKEIVEFEKAQRTTIADLERTQRTTIAELDRAQRTTIAELEKTLRTKPENAEELADELDDMRSKLAAELARTRSELGEELARTRSELAEQLAEMRAELATIRPTVIDDRSRLGMKMSDFALDVDEGHEQAIEYLQPLLVELRSHHSRALLEARRAVAEAEEKLKALEAEHLDTADAALPLVTQRFQPLIDAELIGVTIEQAKVRVARHRLALARAGVEPEDDDPYDGDPTLVRELELEAAQDELEAARARVAALHEKEREAVYHYSHPTAEKSKQLGKQLAKRFRRHH